MRSTHAAVRAFAAAIASEAADIGSATDADVVDMDAKSAEHAGKVPLEQLEMMDLDGNDVDAGALSTLAAALRGNALPALRTLEIDDDMLAHTELVAVCAKRNISLR